MTEELFCIWKKETYSGTNFKPLWLSLKRSNEQGFIIFQIKWIFHCIYTYNTQIKPVVILSTDVRHVESLEWEDIDLVEAQNN